MILNRLYFLKIGIDNCFDVVLDFLLCYGLFNVRI